ncbi:hypothetical protein BDY19DRAFT_979020 [Irpex rosettiformis]|uniref:Uncharacterized protein n=1 Tax=Irpex rosettiformis TaxID=378272 RepID=A0ACB8TMW0_9APHY|nr:hypothetical protein BDY19DRAFT_979020 [Irpex rosettiformis]
MLSSLFRHFPQLITWSHHLLKHPINPAVDNAICRIVQSIGYAIDPYLDGPTFLDNDAVTLDEKHPPHHLVNIYGWLLDNVRITPRWPYQPEDLMVSEKFGCRTIWRRVLTLATLQVLNSFLVRSLCLLIRTQVLYMRRSTCAETSTIDPIYDLYL